MSKHVGEKCGKLCISYILSSKRGITPSKIDAKLWHSNLLCTSKQSHVQNFSSICQGMQEKTTENCKTVYFLYSKFQKRHISFQRDDTRTCSVVHQNKAMCKISAQYVRACRRKPRKTVKLCISYILSSKRGISPSKEMTLKLDL